MKINNKPVYLLYPASGFFLIFFCRRNKFFTLILLFLNLNFVFKIISDSAEIR